MELHSDCKSTPPVTLLPKDPCSPVPAVKPHPVVFSGLHRVDSGRRHVIKGQDVIKGQCGAGFRHEFRCTPAVQRFVPARTLALSFPPLSSSVPVGALVGWMLLLTVKHIIADFV